MQLQLKLASSQLGVLRYNTDIDDNRDIKIEILISR